MMNLAKVRAWQSVKDFFVDVYEVTKNFPPEDHLLD
jgi:hypothetical protein